MVSKEQAEVNKKLIDKFYTSFSERNAEKMVECYDANIHFLDPVFGNLYGEQVGKMWRTLIDKSKGNLKITFKDIWADEEYGGASWQAVYFFKGRKVVNNVEARFRFSESKIIEHSDHFNLWTWSKQALGLAGWFFGWSVLFKNKIQTEARRSIGLEAD